ncbi:MAG: LytTR family DNA-binding domain-containing protein [Aerococcus sp.]|nr:LytTR family DNA-binding domain-containing protein [Aerococcus sp.]
MLDIVIIEDNPNHLGRIEGMLMSLAKEWYTQFHLLSIMSRADYEQQLSDHKPHDLYFIDLEIEGNKDMGFQWAKEIRDYNPYGAIAFVTTLSESMPLAFKQHVAALDFIVKDSSDEQFKKQLADCVQHVMDDERHALQQEIFDYSYGGRHSIHIPYSDILYIETTGDSHRLVLYGPNYRKEFYGALNDIMAFDTHHYFQSVSRSTLVNVNNVLSVDTKTREVVFLDHSRCDITHSHMKELRKRLAARNENDVDVRE